MFTLKFIKILKTAWYGIIIIVNIENHLNQVYKVIKYESSFICRNFKFICLSLRIKLGVETSVLYVYYRITPTRVILKDNQ